MLMQIWEQTRCSLHSSISSHASLSGDHLYPLLHSHFASRVLLGCNLMTQWALCEHLWYKQGSRSKIKQNVNKFFLPFNIYTTTYKSYNTIVLGTMFIIMRPGRKYTVFVMSTLYFLYIYILFNTCLIEFYADLSIVFVISWTSVYLSFLDN